LDNADSAASLEANRPRNLLYVLVSLGGVAALSWEVIWQLKAALAVGVSAEGTAITLAATMGGISIGSVLAGRWLRTHPLHHPARWYGTLEFIIGLSGLLLAPAFRALEQLDAAVYAASPRLAPLLHVGGILLVLGPPTVAMGATVPLFGLMARSYRSSISLLYGLNTFGAGIGVLLIAFIVVPALGVWGSTLAIAAINFLIAAAMWCLPRGDEAAAEEAPAASETTGDTGRLMAVVFVTGFATFGLEVAWFRALRAAYLSTTYTFAILLAAVLLPLALAARKAPALRAQGFRLAAMLAGAGAFILLATPAVERFDMVSRYYAFFVLPSWFIQALAVLGPPMLLLGVVLPWLLDGRHDPRDWGRLYGANTLGAIFGALTMAWVLLPTLGFARSAWFIGAIVVGAALLLGNRRDRLRALAFGAVGLLVAIVAESGVGRTRVIGAGPPSGYQLIAFRETPDSTVSVIETAGRRILFIDGFAAADETKSADYMTWMGRLPMLLHSEPKDALVICFGTGQTADSVRQENPGHLDVVELNPAVLQLAGEFPTNQNVLGDPRVSAIAMDGRAWLRRTTKQYDVITLEPMPPTFAGVNALYSKEFYDLASARLRPGGIVAQWLPFHLLDPHQAASIAATFRAVFPDAILWIDPLDDTGILLGRRDGAGPLEKEWPGLKRESKGRTLKPQEITAAVALDAAGLERFARSGTVITDDNQLLAYHSAFAPGLWTAQTRAEANHERVKQAARGEVPGRGK